MQTDFDILLERQQIKPFTRLFSSIYNWSYNICNSNKIPLHKVYLLIHDLLVVLAAISLAHYIYKIFYQPVLEANEGLIYWIYLLVAFSILLFFKAYDLYKYQVILNKAKHASALFKTFFFSLLTVVFISFLFKIPEILFSRIFIASIYISLFSLFLLSRILVIPSIFFWLVKANLINRNLLIVGIDKLSIKKAKSLIRNKQSYFNICGFVNDEDTPTATDINNIPILGDLKDINKIVKEYDIHDLLICMNCDNEDKLHDIIDACKKAEKTIHVVSGLYNVITDKLEVEEIGRVSAFRVHPPTQSYIYPYLKRLVDILGSIFIIASLFPLWIFIISLIKLDSRGPIFYRARVIGLNGAEFMMYKFRSMYHNCSSQPHEEKVRRMIKENGDTQKLRNDSRITRVGKVLRKLSFDEFPQLINVLKGEMSLVGPRPCLPYEFELLKNWHKKRVLTKPGMTGLWQIKGRDEVLFNDQMVLDLYYIEHQSIFLDLEILLETIPVVIFGKGGN